MVECHCSLPVATPCCCCCGAVVVYLSTGRRGWARQPLPTAHFTDGSAWTGSGRAQLRQRWMLCLTLSLSLMMMMMISLPSRCWQGTSQRSQCSAPLCSASLELAFYMLQQHARVTPAAAQGAITGELQSGPVNIHPARCSAQQQPEIDTIWLFQMFTASHNVWCAGARGPPDCSLLTARTSLHRGPRSSWAQGGGPRRAPVLCCTARGKQG